jgi:glycosyltransferase involved in cell wall biosynthesis
MKYKVLHLNELEDVMLEKPCVVADIALVKEILKNGASRLFISPKHSQALEQAIIRLNSNHQYVRTLGFKARETALNEHNTDKIISKLEDLYIQIINKN